MVIYIGEIVEITIPMDGLYVLEAKGAQAADGLISKGGKGAVISSTFFLTVSYCILYYH